MTRFALDKIAYGLLATDISRSVAETNHVSEALRSAISSIVALADRLEADVFSRNTDVDEARATALAELDRLHRALSQARPLDSVQPSGRDQQP